MEDNDNKTTSSIRIDKDLWLRARMKAVSTGITMGEAIEALLRDWTRERGTSDRKVLLDTSTKKESPSRRSLDDSRFRGKDLE